MQALSSMLLSRPQSQVRARNILSPSTVDHHYCQSQRIMKNWLFILPPVCLAKSDQKSITPIFSRKFHFDESLESVRHSTGYPPWIHPNLLICLVQLNNHATGSTKYFSYLLWMVNDPWHLCEHFCFSSESLSGCFVSRFSLVKDCKVVPIIRSLWHDFDDCMHEHSCLEFDQHMTVQPDYLVYLLKE